MHHIRTKRFFFSPKEYQSERKRALSTKNEMSTKKKKMSTKKNVHTKNIMNKKKTFNCPTVICPEVIKQLHFHLVKKSIFLKITIIFIQFFLDRLNISKI
jgi:hypothetical protein